MENYRYQWDHQDCNERLNMYHTVIAKRNDTEKINWLFGQFDSLIREHHNQQFYKQIIDLNKKLIDQMQQHKTHINQLLEIIHTKDFIALEAENNYIQKIEELHSKIEELQHENEKLKIC